MIQVCKITKCGSLVEWGNHTNIHYELSEIHTVNMANICVQQSHCRGKGYLTQSIPARCISHNPTAQIL